MNMHAAQETDQEQMAQTQKQIIAPLEKAEETQADFNHDVPSRVKKTHKTELDLSRSMFKVLHTPELFELILLQLPMKDLLLAQGISRHFKETIRGSVRLQRQLFLAPAPIGQGSSPILNPLFANFDEQCSHCLCWWTVGVA